MSRRVAVIGAGLSGLACALELKNRGAVVTVFESTSEVGGRVKTENHHGFLLDHGFQVFLPAYERAQYFLNYDKLNLTTFSPGAYIFSQGSFQLISDPLRDPSRLWATLFSPIATVKDKLLTLKLIVGSKIDYSSLTGSQSAISFLKEYGFSQKYIENFFIPFFSGIFLDRELSVSADFFQYLFQRFSKSYACLPEGGMQQIPLQMADEIGLENIKLNQKINLSDADREEFDVIVWAGDPNQVNSNNVDYFSVITRYYKTQSTKWVGKTLYLNGDSKGPVNHVACLTGVNPNYAPEGWQLYAVNVLSPEAGAVEEHLKQMFGADEIQQWQLIKSYEIKHALPKKPQYGKGSGKNSDGIYLCGDYLESPSIQGALTSGYRTAVAIMSER